MRCQQQHIPGHITQKGGSQNSHDTQRKHDHNLHLLPLSQIQPQHLRNRQPQHPHIERNIYGGVRDEHGIHVNTVPRVAAVPALPGVAEGAALVQVRDGEGEAEQEVEGLGAPEDEAEGAADHAEDADVEEEDGGFEGGDGEGVDYFEGEEDLRGFRVGL
ncbi:hypothetical protein CNYM01_01352 [Colletotrichum nymphaeae SA-01]|uniref:Uncharacterized protein n=1 Tax=Colletotrichum nymphaeae SA-01 TaxID=1460502 RepID=A0A135SN33_9PEZI|nr:hypothetical protein CNYM01_01352 [Colletotrichum nymphaeae SA-01]